MISHWTLKKARIEARFGYRLIMVWKLSPILGVTCLRRGENRCGDGIAARKHRFAYRIGKGGHSSGIGWTAKDARRRGLMGRRGLVDRPAKPGEGKGYLVGRV
mgnify:CR=1 FL=1